MSPVFHITLLYTDVFTFNNKLSVGQKYISSVLMKGDRGIQEIFPRNALFIPLTLRNNESDVTVDEILATT